MSEHNTTDNNLKIEFGQVPKVLLLGNGINRAYSFSSWEDLISSIGTKELSAEEKEHLDKVPYPLKPVILTGDHLGTKMKDVSSELAELCACEEEAKLLKDFASLPFDAILTANYTYELEKSLDRSFKCLPGKRCKYRKLAYDSEGKYNKEQLHSYFEIAEHPPIWHIHGEAARHNTIVLGHYYYGKLLAKLQKYASDLLKRYKARTSNGLDMEMRSWLDYFMLGEVHIVGLGMALSEMDLWWLVNYKKRHFPDTRIVLYKQDIKLEEKMLADAYGVQVDSDSFNGNYIEYYNYLNDVIGNKIKDN